MLGETKAQVSEIIQEYDKNTTRDLFQFDIPSMWLSSYGVLTPAFIQNTILIIVNIDSRIRNVDFQYNPHEKKIDLKIFLSKWDFYFHSKKVLEKIVEFMGKNFNEYALDIVIEKVAKKAGFAS